MTDYLEFQPKVRVDLIKRALAKKHEALGDFFITECKSGPSWTTIPGDKLSIFDAIAIKKSWTRPCITIYEIKIDRQDFLADEKFSEYRRHCHRFNFVCPRGLISADEVSNGCGLITFNTETGALKTTKKSVFQDNPLPTKIFYYILMSRLESDRHPFFSSQREYYERLVQEKEQKKILAPRVSSKLLDEIERLKKQSENYRRPAEQFERVNKDLNRLREVLWKNGLTSYYMENLAQDLQEALNNKVSPSVKAMILSLESGIKRIKEAVGIEEEP